MSIAATSNKGAVLAKDMLDLAKNWAFAVGLVVSGGALSETGNGLQFKIAGGLLMLGALAVITVSAQWFLSRREATSTMKNDSPAGHKAKVVLLVVLMGMTGWFVYAGAMDYIAVIRDQHRHAAQPCSAGPP